MAEPLVLFGIGCVVIALRTHVRIKIAGRRFRADDYLMFLVLIPYIAETILAYDFHNKYEAKSNNSLTEEERAQLALNGREYMLRVNGAKTSLAYYVLYTLSLWMMKGAALSFFLRLTERLGNYRRRIHFGFLLTVVTWVIDVLTILLTCRPLHRYWQIYPDPGEYCHPSVSPVNLFVTFGLNAATDLYILSIPLPLLWMASIKLWRKLGLIALVGGNVFVIAAGVVRCYLIFSTRQHDAAAQAGLWTTRVTFVSVVTTNLPMLLPAARRRCRLLLRPFLGHRSATQNMRPLRTISVVAHVATAIREAEQLIPPPARVLSKDAAGHRASPVFDDIRDVERAETHVDYACSRRIP
ncbi:hypothetical protein F4780DRAFT_741686 [Xylariomycetidae sp. FL0641]|nr:hypothetical protein F4780DRAFT_741686 [Xylariomycetidae sp. FL0641]